ncbi:MAG: adhesin, partial [Methanobrevibacter sp.]|nr:adhesin [Methanobrevibacter sp.]
MNIKKVNIVFNIIIICLFTLCLVSTVSANDEVVNTNFTDGNNYVVTSDLSNDDIQSMFDNANNGDTFQFTSENYDNISLVIDKQLNIL